MIQSIDFLKGKKRIDMFEGLNMGDLMKRPKSCRNNSKIAGRTGEYGSYGESGAGMVKVIMNGRHDVRKVTVDPAFFLKRKNYWKICWQPL